MNSAHLCCSNRNSLTSCLLQIDHKNVLKVSQNGNPKIHGLLTLPWQPGILFWIKILCVREQVSEHLLTAGGTWKTDFVLPGDPLSQDILSATKESPTFGMICVFFWWGCKQKHTNVDLFESHNFHFAGEPWQPLLWEVFCQDRGIYDFMVTPPSPRTVILLEWTFNFQNRTVCWKKTKPSKTLIWPYCLFIIFII